MDIYIKFPEAPEGEPAITSGRIQTWISGDNDENNMVSQGFIKIDGEESEITGFKFPGYSAEGELYEAGTAEELEALLDTFKACKKSEIDEVCEMARKKLITAKLGKILVYSSKDPEAADIVGNTDRPGKKTHTIIDTQVDFYNHIMANHMAAIGEEYTNVTAEDAANQVIAVIPPWETEAGRIEGIEHAYCSIVELAQDEAGAQQAVNDCIESLNELIVI